MSDFSERLLAERKRLELTQDQMAEIAGVSKSAYCNYEGTGTKDRIPDLEFLNNLSKAGVDPLYVLTGNRVGAVESPGARYLTKQQEALLDNLEHCPKEVQDAISKLALAVGRDDTDVETKTS